MISTILAITTILFTHYTSSIDAVHLNKGEWIDNKVNRWFQRAFAIVPISVYNVELFFACGILFYVLFDQMLNIKRRIPFLHLGDKGIDKFFKKRIYLYIAVKLILIGVSAYLFIKNS